MKTIDGLKELQIEISQQQHRLDAVKQEKVTLEKQRDALKEEAKNISAVLEQQNAQKYTELKRSVQDIEEQRSKLDADKAEFVKALTDLKQQKSAFERERQDSLDAKNNANDITEKIGVFIRLVKAEAAKL